MRTRGFEIYKKLVLERPYCVQAVQTASLMCAGDVISQFLATKEHTTPINTSRTIRFGAVGLVFGPVLMKWYTVLDKLNSGSRKVAFARKIALDQLIFAPIAVACITTAVTLADGKTLDDVVNKLKMDYFQIMLTNYKVWPLVQCINFSIVPLHYRVPVTQLVAVGWNAYLSWKLNSNNTKI